jgi:hypothetical protein
MELARLAPGAQTVLSGGCSGSWYFEWFERTYGSPIKRHIGVEAYSPEPDDLPSRVEWLDRTLGDLHPVSDASVDLVFAGQVLEHMWADEVVGFLLEAHRVLRLGGTLCIDSPNRRVTLGTGWWQPEHTVEFTVPEVACMLELAGFSDIEIRGVWLGFDRGTGRFLPVDIATGGPDWPWQKRVREAADRPEDSFVWWATAVRASRQPFQEALRDHVEGIHNRARPEYLGRLRSLVGEPTAPGVVRGRSGEAGYLLFGPYLAMPPGEARVVFRLGRPDDGRVLAPDDVLLRLDVCTGEQTVAETTITAAMLPTGPELTEVDLPFRFDQTAFGVEFRAFTTGLATVDAELRVSLEGLDGRAATTSDESLDIQARLHKADEETRRLNAALADLMTSASWRLTAPLRSAAACLRRLGSRHQR